MGGNRFGRNGGRRAPGLMAAAALAFPLLTTSAGAMTASLSSVAVTAAQTPTSSEANSVAIARRRDGIDVRQGSRIMRIEAVTDEILRIRIARDGQLPEDASWAVLPAMRTARVAVTALPDGFRTSALTVRIAPSDGRMTIVDATGRIISADAERPIRDEGAGFGLAKILLQGEHYYGLGDKTGPLDRRGGFFVNWNTDAYKFQESTDPLYKSIPFFVATGGAGGAYGLLLDNIWRSWFDFGRRDAGTLSFGSNGGPIDYYFIAGPDVAHVITRYAGLTGKPPLPPLWAFGYQQSRYSYMSADEVRAIANRLRAEHFPTDVIWLDIDFQDRNRPFTANPKTYPDLPRLARDMRLQGIKLITIADLHVAHAPDQGYAPYDSGMAGDHFVKNGDGSPYIGKVWPGPAVFPDFTRETTRIWWGTLFKPFADAGIAGFWNDMNEPSVFETPGGTIPLDTVHRIEGSGFASRTASHAEVHNILGMENSRGTYEGLLKLRPDERPFVMTRATFAGGQRYATTWTGDDSASWSHLKLAVSQMLNLGLSGFTYTASDVGGFIGGSGPDLMTRWFEIQAFTPLFRQHSANDTPAKEPWVDGPAHLEIRRRFVEERYRLMPYFYALADENTRTGAPLIRPLFYDYADAPNMGCDQSMSFTLGGRLMVAASPTPDSPLPYNICLPAGKWYDYWTGVEVKPRPVTTSFNQTAPALVETPRVDHLPVFVREGTILPRQPLVQSLDETPDGPLELHVYPGQDCHGQIYADDGHTLAYKRGIYMRQTIRCAATSKGLTISFDRRDGTYRPWWKQVALIVHGWSGPARVSISGNMQPSEMDASTGTVHITLSDTAGPRVVQVERN